MLILGGKKQQEGEKYDVAVVHAYCYSVHSPPLPVHVTS